MADDRVYRIQIRYDAEDGTFTADAPELGLSTSADSRSEAVERIEEAIEDRIHAAAEGDPLPQPADLREVSGVVTLKISPRLHRALILHAESSRLSPEALASELLSMSVGELEGLARRPAPPAKDPAPSDNDHRGASQPRRRNRREGYRPDMDNQANFLEYVRNLERGGGRGRR